MKTEAIREQTASIDAASRKLAETRRMIRLLKMECGQEIASITINGVTFPLTCLNSAYRPQVSKGMEEVQRICLSILAGYEATEKSQLEGAQWRLKQLVKE
jgi:hypothetical protein